MKNAGKMLVFGTLGLLGAGLLLSGCRPAPELTQAKAQAMIQAQYDQTPAAGADIVVDEQGLVQGVAANYWKRTKLYPNRYWADFTLTPEGEKAIKLQNGGDVIQWRPDSPGDKSFSAIVITTAANHPIARALKEIQDEMLPGVSTAKGVEFTEVVNLDGVPSALQDIAHNPGNRLSTQHQADFVLDRGVWKLHSIE